MATCKDCVCNELCTTIGFNNGFKGGEQCRHFKDKSRYIELPCKVGDTVYCIDYILEITEKCIVYGFQIFANGKIQLLVNNGESKFVTPNWYTTKEEAEKALKERYDNYHNDIIYEIIFND